MLSKMTWCSCLLSLSLLDCKISQEFFLSCFLLCPQPWDPGQACNREKTPWSGHSAGARYTDPIGRALFDPNHEPRAGHRLPHRPTAWTDAGCDSPAPGGPRVWHVPTGRPSCSFAVRPGVEVGFSQGIWGLGEARAPGQGPSQARIHATSPGAAHTVFTERMNGQGLLTAARNSLHHHSLTPRGGQPPSIHLWRRETAPQGQEA